MLRRTICLFGAAEKGALCQPIALTSLQELHHQLGNPPNDTEGLNYAIQMLLSHYGLIYFRVSEEGYSLDDYKMGLRWLKTAPIQSHVSALCLPGVSDEEIIEASLSICQLYHLILIVSEKDFYDYLTAK